MILILLLLCLLFISYIDMRSFFPSLPFFISIPFYLSFMHINFYLSLTRCARYTFFLWNVGISSLIFFLCLLILYTVCSTRHLRRLRLLLFLFYHPSIPEQQKMLYSLTYSRRFIKKRASRHFVTNCKYSSSLWKPFRDGRHKNRLINIIFSSFFLSLSFMCFFLLDTSWIVLRIELNLISFNKK